MSRRDPSKPAGVSPLKGIPILEGMAGADHVGFSAGADLRARLARAAKEQKCTRSEVCRRALEDFLEK